MPKYKDSASTIEDKEEVIQSLTIRMDEKDCTISSKEEEIQQLRQQLQQERDQASKQLEERERQLQQENEQASREYRTQLQEKERQLGRVNQQLEASEQVVAQFERRIVELEQQLSQREQQKTNRGKELTSFKLRWREGKRVPYKIRRCFDAVVDGNIVYIKNERKVNTYSYDTTSDSWSQLPDCDHERGSIAIISGWLTTVGGGSYPIYYNELFSLTGEGSGRRWTKKFPPMPTKRCWTTSLCTGTTLIVAGGFGELRGVRVLSTVEVMNTETHQWSTAADLPEPMYLASATVCGDQIYMLDGINKEHQYSKSVYTCSVSALLQSCVQSSLEAKLKRTLLEDKASVWRRIADLPVTHSTCESFCGRLLAVGGNTDSEKYTTAVHMYNSTTNSWEIISHMTTGRFECFTAVLPDNQLMVMGGITAGEVTDSVELANVLIQKV